MFRHPVRDKVDPSKISPEVTRAGQNAPEGRRSMDQSIAVVTVETIDRRIIAEQARKVRALYPELFAALDERDRSIRRALYRIPHPADPEALVPPQVDRAGAETLRQCKTGISQLCEEGV